MSSIIVEFFRLPINPEPNCTNDTYFDSCKSKPCSYLFLNDRQDIPAKSVWSADLFKNKTRYFLAAFIESSGLDNFVSILVNLEPIGADSPS